MREQLKIKVHPEPLDISSEERQALEVMCKSRPRHRTDDHTIDAFVLHFETSHPGKPIPVLFPFALGRDQRGDFLSMPAGTLRRSVSPSAWLAFSQVLGQLTSSSHLLPAILRCGEEFGAMIEEQLKVTDFEITPGMFFLASAVILPQGVVFYTEYMSVILESLRKKRTPLEDYPPLLEAAFFEQPSNHGRLSATAAIDALLQSLPDILNFHQALPPRIA